MLKTFSVTQLTPFQPLTFFPHFHFQPPCFTWKANPSESPAVDDWFRHSEEVWEQAHQCLTQVSDNKGFADHHRSETPQFQPGNWVWLSTRDIRNTTGCKKLTARYTGPVTYKLDLPCYSCLANSFHFSQLKQLNLDPYTWTHLPLRPQLLWTLKENQPI